MTMKWTRYGLTGKRTGLRASRGSVCASQGSACANGCKGLHTSTERPTGHEL